MEKTYPHTTYTWLALNVINLNNEACHHLVLQTIKHLSQRLNKPQCTSLHYTKRLGIWKQKLLISEETTTMIYLVLCQVAFLVIVSWCNGLLFKDHWLGVTFRGMSAVSVECVLVWVCGGLLMVSGMVLHGCGLIQFETGNTVHSVFH